MAPRASALLLFAALAASTAAAQAPDPRVGLRAGLTDAGTATRNLELVAHVPRPEGFVNPDEPGDFGFANTDLAFQGDLLFLGSYAGVQVWDISEPTRPALRSEIRCPGGQGDVSVHGDLLFMSVEETRGRVDCGAEGVEAPVSAERFRGVRIFDISDVEEPRQVAAVQTCRGSHTHTLVPDPTDPDNVYVYVSGTSGVRPGDELAGCSAGGPDDPNTSLFRVEVIRVPVDDPEEAAVVGTPRFLVGLSAPPVRGIPADQQARAEADAARLQAEGRFTVVMEGNAVAVPQEYVDQALAGVLAQRGGAGAATAADSAMVQTMFDQYAAQMSGAAGPDDPGPDQCHDITVFPEVGLAGGACAGYGILLDIRDPANPTRITAAADSNFAYWHSATFSNDGRKVVFTDEWGGGGAPRCRATDRPEWGANAIFSIDEDELTFESYYKLPAAQTELENCVAHNGSIVPVPGRDLMAQAWYQGGLSVFDFTDPANPVEVAYFDRGPMNGDEMMMGGYWSVYWYNGHLYASEIGRGLDVFRLTPGEGLSDAEIAAAESVEDDELNAQHQTRVEWAPSESVVRAYLDQLGRSGGLTAEQRAAVEAGLAEPDDDNLLAAARGLDAAASSDPERVRMLAAALEALATAPR